MSNIKMLLEDVEVEWKPISKSLVRTQGTSITATQMRVLHKENAPLKIFAGGKTVAFVNFDDIPYKDINREPSIIVKSRGIIEFEYYDKPFTHKKEMWSYHSKNEYINIKFVYYFLKKNEPYFQNIGNRMQMPQISTPDTDNFLIPIPCPNDPEKSLEIQKEIVRILDKFSTLTAELQAELQARKSQYEYYRNQLLTYPMEESDQPSLRSSQSATSIQNSDNPTQPLSTPNPHTGNSVLQPHNKVEWKTLGEVVLPTSNIRWKNTNKFYRYIDLTSVCRDNNTIIETIEINKENAPSRAQKLVLKNDVIFATTRPTQQRLCLIPEEYNGEVASTGYCVLRANIDLVLPKWIYFWITSNKFKNYVEENQSGSAYPAISDAKVKEFKIPIPYPNDIEKSLKEQERIVAILDKFNTLTTSITEGLPKEIELRQKQYEYYRDMLLTFPTDNIKV